MEKQEQKSDYKLQIDSKFILKTDKACYFDLTLSEILRLGTAMI